jgi:uncharacterized membrane protein YtjA (UPF0391 family)
VKEASPVGRHLPSGSFGRQGRKGCVMIYYTLVFLIVELIAGALGLAGVAIIASQTAWILFLIGMVLLVLELARGRTPPVA